MSVQPSTQRPFRLSAYQRGLCLMLTPYLVGIIGLLLVPMLMTVGLSFTEYDTFTPPRWIGLDNYLNFRVDSLFQRALLNSLWFALVGVGLRVAVAFLLALALNHPSRLAQITRAAVYLPSILPEIAYALVWLLILNPSYGPLNLLLGSLGLPTPAWTLEPFTARASVVVMWTFQMGEGFVLLLAARQMIPRDLYETAMLDGASRWHIFRRITLPLMAPALILLGVRDTDLSLQASFVPGLITTDTGPYYATYFLPHYVFDGAFGSFKYGYASAITVVMYALTAVLVGLILVAARQWSRPDDL